MINLSPAGYRPRAFGEEDFFGGPVQGVCVLDVLGDSLSVNFQTVTREWFTYPEKFREFDYKKYALWFNHPWELPSDIGIRNGDFSQGLEHWHQRFVYPEDNNPSNIIDVRKGPEDKESLYLYSRKRDYDVPGQDRLPQHINRIAQAVALKDLASPILQISYHPQQGHFDPNSLNGFFLWLQFYTESYNEFNLIYSVGKVYGGISQSFGADRKTNTYHFDLPSQNNEWSQVFLPIAKDYESQTKDGSSFESFNLDKVIIYLGTWTVNEGIGQEAGIYVENISLKEGNMAISSTAKKEETNIWPGKADHVAGEHQYVSQSQVYPPSLQNKGKQ